MIIVEIQVTYPNETAANDIANEVIKKSLAACVNVIPTQSTYSWENKIINEGEYIALFKTNRSSVEKLIQAIKSAHPYTVPAIVWWEVNATEEYAEWVGHQLKH